ncbi:hypothetical protein L1S32_07500 [Methanogenium sp. S4BF]|uniref:hypothetical protein n=1 Tax=Methanogenium sp. S4BF TaxID=1789226 RepID=UPI002416448E|nr:hypothetical protein [Methanogenium sp. S4BF]WFN33689.1 hypothetical protein L1S32_07500 [Methanogenium sp. S4BF]
MKIYVRPRQKVGEGAHQPMFKVVAVTGKGEEKLKMEAGHFRKKELETIAADVGAEIVMLEPSATESGKGKT